MRAAIDIPFLRAFKIPWTWLTRVWSFSTTRVAYVTFPEFSIWVSQLDGSNRRQLTFPPTYAFLPRWAPDGSRIVYTDLRAEGRSRVFIVPRDSGVPTPLIPDDSNNEIDPTWMPDGHSIVFARTHLDRDLAIYQIDLQTRKVRMVPGSQELTGRRLSPDGRWICALSRDWTTVMLYDVRAERWQQLAKAETGGFGYTNWSHDGKWMYACRIPHSAVRISISDHHIEPIVDLNDFR
jgi:Tol biopolymer transport system component